MPKQEESALSEQLGVIKLEFFAVGLGAYRLE